MSYLLAARYRSHVSILLCLVWCAIPMDGYTQVMLSPAFTKPKVVDAEPKANRSMTIHAQGQPDPLLRYRLWPPPEKRRQRATMTAVNRALLMVGQVSADDKRNFLDHYDQWATLRLDELPIADAKGSCAPFETAISVLRTGENWMDTRYDLGIDEMSLSEKVGTLLPEFQEMRDLARLLSIRARVAAAEDRWDDAVAELRLGFRLSEVAGHSTDTLLGRLIGSAIVEVMLDTTEAMIQDPDCPNLYWALCGLPIEHLVDMRGAIEYESALATHIGSIAGLAELPDEIIGKDRALVRIRKITDAFSSSFGPIGRPMSDSTWNQMSTGFQITMMVQPARELLSQHPAWKDRVSQLSDAEAVLRASDIELSRIRDRWLAWSLLPDEVWQDSQDQRLRTTPQTINPVTLGGKLARMMLPDVQRVVEVGRETKQKHHRLVTLEAIRVHAAQSGELPATIDELLPVPAWRDPVARKPFQYTRRSPIQAKLTRRAGTRKRDDITLEINLESNQ